MNYSEYLKQRVKCQTNYIKRGGFVDAGFHTSIVGRRVADNQSYKPSGALGTPVVPNACCLASSGASGSYVEPVKLICAGSCSEVSSITTTPYIVISGCEPSFLSTTGAVGGCYCIQGTPAKYIEAVAERVHREKNCCAE
jgi:hypothetical protein